MSLTSTIVVWTTQALADDLGVSDRTINRYIIAGELAAAKQGRRWIVEAEEAERFRITYRHIGRPRKQPVKAHAVAELQAVIEDGFARIDAALERIEKQDAVMAHLWSEIEAEKKRLGMGELSPWELEDRRRSADVSGAGR